MCCADVGCACACAGGAARDRGNELSPINQLALAAGDHNHRAGLDLRIRQIQIVAGPIQYIIRFSFELGRHLLKRVALFPRIKQAVHWQDGQGHAGLEIFGIIVEVGFVAV